MLALMDDRRRRFEARVLPHLDAAYNLARWLARSPADAEDVVQDAMLRAFKGFDDVRSGDARPWLLAIVRNCFLSGVRARRPTIPLDGEGESGALAVASEGPDPERAAINADEGRRLEAVLANLPDEFREVLVLRELEECSYKDIAEITGVPIGTVMSRLSRARLLLKETWRGLS
jgi:RNA polymerase sigma-70 factor (ECF subfamily)